MVYYDKHHMERSRRELKAAEERLGIGDVSACRNCGGSLECIGVYLNRPGPVVYGGVATCRIPHEAEWVHQDSLERTCPTALAVPAEEDE